MRSLVALVAALWIAVVPHAAAAAANAPERIALERLFARATPDSASFAPSFLAKVSISDIASFVDSYKSRLGAPASIDKDGGEWKLRSAQGSIKVDIACDARGRISSLLFHDELSADNLAALQRVLAAGTIAPEWFEPSYLNDIPTTKLESLLADMHAALGPFVRVETRGGAYFAIFEKGESHAQISAGPDGRIDYLAFSRK